jgi:ATP-binding cassette, subfamily B, bacterial
VFGPHGGQIGQRPRGRRAPVRRVVAQFRPYKRQVAIVGLTIFVTSGLGVVNPLLIRAAFDNALFVRNGPNLGLLYVLVGFMVGLPIVLGAIGVLQTYLANRVGQLVMQDLRDALYTHLQAMSLRFFTNTRTGEIQSRLANDVGGVQTVVTDTASSILSNIVTVVSTVIAMVIISWQLTVLSLFILPLFLWLTYRIGNRRRGITAQAQQAMAEMSAITEETLSVSGILLSKIFNRQQDEVRRYHRENERLALLSIREQMVGRYFFAGVQIFFSLTPALVYLVAGISLAHHTSPAISAGTLVAFTTLQTRLFFPIGQMLQVSVEVHASLALFQRIFEYLDLPVDISDAPAAAPLPKASVRGEVAFEHVYFRYDAEAAEPPAALPDEPTHRGYALHDLSLRVEPGQLAALVGPSGAGKTTVSYLIPRLYDVTGGAVRIDGHDVRDLQLASLADAIGIVTQESYLFHATVRENLAYARDGATQAEIEAAARAANIHERIVQLPNGYDSIVGERGYRLSGGEKQRLAIARVILKDPRILILDEATSALDTASERLVQAALQPLMRGRTTIAIAHRLSTILAADVIFVIDQGRLVEQGTHTELVQRGGLYASLYAQQFGGGVVEARCEDGVVLASGAVVRTPATAAAAG